MKRLVMIMLAALMLIFSVGGSAETIPEKKIDLTQYENVEALNKANVWVYVERGRGDSMLVKKSDNYWAYYSFGGDLLKYSYTYDDGCQIMYSRDGSVFMDDYYKKNFGPDHGTLYWVNGKWSMRQGEDFVEDTTLTSPEKDHNPETAHQAPIALGEVKPNMPPRQVVDAYSFGGVDYAQLRQHALDAFPNAYTFGTGDDVTSASKGDYILARKGKYGWEFGLYKGYDLYEVYIGTLCFSVMRKDNGCVMAYNSKYGTYTKGYYNLDTGELEEIWVRTPDDSLVAVYSDKNVLKSYEIWSRTEGTWEFVENKWAHYTVDGVKDADTPTEEVLKKILLIPGVAVYETECATSTSKVADTSVPFIVASASALSTSTTVTVAAEKTSETETVYDIKLDGGNTEPTGDVTLFLPYPNGMTAEIAEDYDFAVVHKKGKTTTEMSTVAGSVECTAYGLKVTTDSFSPYTVDWGKADAIADKYPDAIQPNEGKVDTGSLPQTGDTTNMALLLGVLAASVCALALVLRKRSVCR